MSGVLSLTLTGAKLVPAFDKINSKCLKFYYIANIDDIFEALLGYKGHIVLDYTKNNFTTNFAWLTFLGFSFSFFFVSFSSCDYLPFAQYYFSWLLMPLMLQRQQQQLKQFLVTELQVLSFWFKAHYLRYNQTHNYQGKGNFSMKWIFVWFD